MTINQSGWRPEAPLANGAGEQPTFTGNRALLIEEALLFETGRVDVTGVDIEEAGAFTPRLGGLERDTQALAVEIDSCIRELQALGVVYKMPFDAGLVDFPGEIDGRAVYLCWRLGESSVEYWHELEAGYAGRQPLVPQPIP